MSNWEEAKDFNRQERKKEVYERVVHAIKAAAEDISNNAEIIAGGYDYQTGDVVITITVNDNSLASVKVEQEFIPYGLVRKAVIGERHA